MVNWLIGLNSLEAGRRRSWEGERIRVKGRMMDEGGGTRVEKKLRRVEAKKVRRKEGWEGERIREERLNG